MPVVETGSARRHLRTGFVRLHVRGRTPAQKVNAQAAVRVPFRDLQKWWMLGEPADALPALSQRSLDDNRKVTKIQPFRMPSDAT